MPAITGPIELDAEYRVMREQAGLLERGGRGVLIVSGPGAAEYLQGQLTNDLEALAPGEGAYAALLDRKGRMLADARVLCTDEQELRLDSDPPGLEPLCTHLERHRVGSDAETVRAGEALAVLSLIGPQSSDLAGATLSPEHAHTVVEIGAIAARAVRTDLGVDLICAGADREALTAALIEAGAVVVSAPAAEILRVESGRPRLGHEIDERTIPEEAGLNERAVSFSKGCYVGQETVARLHYRGKPNRRLRGLRLSRPLESGVELSLDGKTVGKLGTACISPALGAIGLAIVRREAEPGATLQAGGEGATAELVELPFAA